MGAFSPMPTSPRPLPVSSSARPAETTVGGPLTWRPGLTVAGSCVGGSEVEGRAWVGKTQGAVLAVGPQSLGPRNGAAVGGG